MTTDTEMKVSVSGSTVYKAVANYLKNSEEMRQHIKEAVEKALANGALEKSILHQVECEIRRYYYEKTLEKEIAKVIREAVKEQVQARLTKKDLLAMVKSTVTAMLVNDERGSK